MLLLARVWFYDTQLKTTLTHGKLDQKFLFQGTAFWDFQIEQNMKPGRISEESFHTAFSTSRYFQFHDLNYENPGYSSAEFSEEVCRPVHQTLTFFQIKN